LRRGDNLICSGLSVLTALAMVRNGAAGETAAQMDRALGLPSLDRLNAGMNAVDQALAERSGKRRRPDGSKATVSLRVANSVWGQEGLPWEPTFLAVLASDYGSGVHPMDFAGDPVGATTAINSWVAQQTADRITDIVAPGVIDPSTRLVLVNAIHLKAPWLEPFVDVEPRSFATPTGSVSAPMIAQVIQASAISGPDWQATRIPLAGGELAVTVVLPDRDLPDLVGSLDAGGLADLLASLPVGSVDLTMPRISRRSRFSLGETLVRMGMARAFSDEAEFPGPTRAEQLRLAYALHRGWIEVDADGVEAAAATVVTMDQVSAPLPPRRTLVLDRSYLFCLHDAETAVPLLVGVVNDPTAS